jgi:hypothetical protein
MGSIPSTVPLTGLPLWMNARRVPTSTSRFIHAPSQVLGLQRQARSISTSSAHATSRRVGVSAPSAHSMRSDAARSRSSLGKSARDWRTLTPIPMSRISCPRLPFSPPPLPPPPTPSRSISTPATFRPVLPRSTTSFGQRRPSVCFRPDRLLTRAAHREPDRQGQRLRRRVRQPARINRQRHRQAQTLLIRPRPPEPPAPGCLHTREHADTRPHRVAPRCTLTGRVLCRARARNHLHAIDDRDLAR